MNDAQSTIIGDYAAVMQDRGAVVDFAAARRWGKAYDYFLREWLPADKDAAIADVACGSGHLLLFLQDRGYTNVSGCDLSPTQVQLAKQITEHAVEGDAIAFLDARADSLDLITGLDIIEHMSKDDAMDFLRACHRALRPGGRLILQTPNLDSPLGPSVRYGDFTHQTGFTPDILSRILRMTGFTDVAPREMGPVRRGYSLSSSMRFVAWQAIRAGINLFNTVETGARGSGIHSRVFLITGSRT